MKNPMKKAVGKKVSEYGGMEKYSSKKAEMKHEKKEGKAMEMKEKSMYPKPGRSVVKTRGIVSREVDGKRMLAKEKTKTVTKGGLVKKTVVKGKGVPGSVIGKYKEVKRYK
jgi:hypothetical protein